ncbi:pyridoxal phosphate-dependent transferase [Paraphoma chrysanthemicola]|nr:pyridoxal phosphate-dependent transferase [Paraphoma chrysanthemicola]
MSPRTSPFDLQKCARPNILALEPYRCARDDYKDDGTNILLDANENAYGPGLALNGDGKLPGAKANGTDAASSVDVDLLGLNRYPDPHQVDLKQQLCTLRNTHHHTSKTLTPDHLFVGVGSDEAIDALIRAFCVPGREKILVCPPTYGMYSVSAQVNDVSLVKVPLQLPSFDLDVPAIIGTLSKDSNIKLAYLCSPGNPTGKVLRKEDIKRILEHESWNGVIVVDEAYIDFAPEGTSLAEWVTEWPNLVVMQTLSKAFGLAGIRLGTAFADPAVARILNSMKAPYNISNPTSQIAQAALSTKHLPVMRKNVDLIVKQRERLLEELPKIPGVGKLHGGTESNFLLYQMLDAPGGKPSNEVALAVYEGLAEKRGVVVRFRGKEHGCLGCLRITVGTEKEVDRFLQEIRTMLESIYSSSGKVGAKEEQRREKEANDVVA